MLMNTLGKHPNVVTSGHDEGLFYSIETEKKAKKISRYALMFPILGNGDDHMLVDKTPKYADDPSALWMMAEVIQDLRVVLVIREPVRRMVSYFARHCVITSLEMSYSNFERSTAWLLLCPLDCVLLTAFSWLHHQILEKRLPDSLKQSGTNGLWSLEGMDYPL